MTYPVEFYLLNEPPGNPDDTVFLFDNPITRAQDFHTLIVNFNIPEFTLTPIDGGKATLVNDYGYGPAAFIVHEPPKDIIAISVPEPGPALLLSLGLFLLAMIWTKKVKP